MKAVVSLLALCLGLDLMTMPAQAAPWARLESEHFIIYSDADATAARAYTAKLEAFYELTSAFYDDMSDNILPSYGKTRLNYFAKVEEFRVVMPELGGGGFTPALSCREGTQYFSTAEANGNNHMLGQTVIDPDIDLNLAYLFFAYNDHVLHERFSTLPSWVRNGLNWYFMTAIFKNGKVMVGKPAPGIALVDGYELENIANRKTIIPFTDLIAGKPVPPSLHDMIAYEDWLMVSYLMSDLDRRKSFFDYLKKVDGGMASSEAFTAAIGRNPEMFRDVMKTYANKGIPYQSYAVDPLPDASITLTSLPKYGVNVPLIDAALQTCPTKALGADLLATLRKTAPQFPDDTLVQTALARAEIGFGDPHAALPYLTDRIAANPQDYDSQLLLGKLYLQLAEQASEQDRKQNFAAARRELGKAYTLNPASAPGLYLYARAFADQPDYPNDNTMNAVRLAQDYSGGKYDMYQAELTLRRNHYADAQKIIDEILPFSQQDKARASALQALHDALAAHAPQSSILPLFASYNTAFPRD